jgi:hypothetical protein
MEGGIGPILECLSDKDYDEGLLRPRVVCGVVWKFKVKKHRFLYDHRFFHFFVNIDFSNRCIVNLFS